MSVYAVEYTYVQDTAALDRTRPEHREYLRGLFASGTVLASGPYTDDVGHALLVFKAADRTELEVLLANDPFARAGLIAQTAVRTWNPVIGPWDL